MSSTGFEFPEPLVAAILGQAIKEGRAAELWDVLSGGGSATIDTQTGKLVTANAEVLQQMWNRPPEPCTYEGCPYPTNPRYNHDHPPDTPGLARNHYEKTGRDLAALGFTVGKWADDLRHAEPCDCDLDEEQAGDGCLCNSDWYWALMRDMGAHGWSMAFPLSTPEGKTAWMCPDCGYDWSGAARYCAFCGTGRCICMTAADLGFSGWGDGVNPNTIAATHPECPQHGHEVSGGHIKTTPSREETAPERAQADHCPPESEGGIGT